MIRDFSTKQKVALIIPLVVAVAAFAVVWMSGSSSSPAADDAIIETLIPLPNAKVLQQTEVGLDLLGGWGAKLIVNGVAIPDDQLTVSEGRARYTFKPGPGQEIEVLQAGQNCATAVYWPLISPEQTFTRSWCFSVL